MRKILIALVFCVSLVAPALADWTGKDASGSTITFKNSGTCTSVVCVPQAQPVDSTGAAFAVVTNPMFVAGGQPASTTMQNGATANGNGTNLTVTGYQMALVNVNCSVACSGGTTINFEGTDSTGTFFSVAAYPVAANSTAVSSATTTGQFWVPASGLTSLRARISAYSAGTITVTGTPIYGQNAMAAQVVNSNTNGQKTMANSSPVVVASDQSAVPVSAASGAIASGAVASGAIASGAYASGAVSSGAYASGSLASGAVVDITNMSVATGSAPPSKAIYLGANASGATGGQLRGLINCDNHVFKHITTATDTLAVQGVASQTIYICGWRSRAAGVATWFLENTASTNANCGSTLTQITGVATEAANTGEINNNPIWGGLKNTAGNGLCINSTGTGGVDVDIWYTQF